MSWHEHDDLDAEDLVARARRGLLSPAEQITLEGALEARPELQTAYRVGVELDRAGAVQGGDEALIARAADAALARAQAVTGRTSSRPAKYASRLAVAAALALSLVSATGIATALWTGAVVWPFAAAPAKPAASSQPPGASQKPAKKPHRRPGSPTSVEPAPPAALEAVPEAVVAPEPAVAEQPAPGHGTAAAAANAASELFHAANSARRAGDRGRARRLYSRLIEAHPSSDEAGLARVSLGSLLLGAGDARGAERQFRMYLAEGGQLSEEALVGQAQSSGQLQHTHAEQLAWQRLLASYPSSVYAAQARKRLAEIDVMPHEGTP